MNKYNQECIKLRTFVAATFCCTNGVARRIFRKTYTICIFYKIGVLHHVAKNEKYCKKCCMFHSCNSFCNNMCNKKV